MSASAYHDQLYYVYIMCIVIQYREHWHFNWKSKF